MPSPPAEPGVARIVAIANQKGGVGKSTTAVSLGAALAELGFRILVVDLDPQGNASTGMGIRHEARGVTVYDVVLSEAPVESAIVPTSVNAEVLLLHGTNNGTGIDPRIGRIPALIARCGTAA